MTYLLAGLEEGLCQVIADRGFRFSGVYLRSIPLHVGTHFFAKWMPETADIQKTLPEGRNFDPHREPVTAFFDVPGSSRVLPSSSHGGKHELMVEVTVRLPKPGTELAQRAGELVSWMEERLIGARAGDYRIKNVLPQGTPGGFVRQADGMLFASSRVLFFCVPLTH